MNFTPMHKQFDKIYNKGFFSNEDVKKIRFELLSLIESEILQAVEEREKEIEALKIRLEDVTDSLADMYGQYCGDGHSFMSAGERAMVVLRQETKMKFGKAGEILTHPNKNE